MCPRHACMALEFKASVMKVGNGLLITIPKAVCDGFRIEKGDTLTLRVTDDSITIPLSERQRAIHDEVKRLR